jgi:hypothetical protein
MHHPDCGAASGCIACVSCGKDYLCFIAFFHSMTWRQNEHFCFYISAKYQGKNTFRFIFQLISFCLLPQKSSQNV